METTTASVPGGQPAPGWEWMSPASMVLIALGMALALAIIWWGIRQRRRRAQAEAQHEAVVEAHAHSAVPIETVLAEPVEAAPVMPPIAPAPIETDIAEPAEPMPVSPPTAPAPPPLADVAPVVATSPVAAPSLSAAPTAAATMGNELGRMKGVGPKLAARLTELGYTRFDQIAALSPAEADALDAQLGSFRGRLTRDRWIEQASYLAKDDRTGFEAAFGRL